MTHNTWIPQEICNTYVDHVYSLHIITLLLLLENTFQKFGKNDHFEIILKSLFKSLKHLNNLNSNQTLFLACMLTAKKKIFIICYDIKTLVVIMYQSEKKCPKSNYLLLTKVETENRMHTRNFNAKLFFFSSFHFRNNTRPTKTDWGKVYFIVSSRNSLRSISRTNAFNI